MTFPENLTTEQRRAFARQWLTNYRTETTTTRPVCDWCNDTAQVTTTDHAGWTERYCPAHYTEWGQDLPITWVTWVPNPGTVVTR